MNTIDIEASTTPANPQTMALERTGSQPLAPVAPSQEVKQPITAAQAKVDAVANLTMHAY